MLKQTYPLYNKVIAFKDPFSSKSLSLLPIYRDLNQAGYAVSAFSRDEIRHVMREVLTQVWRTNFEAFDEAGLSSLYQETKDNGLVGKNILDEAVTKIRTPGIKVTVDEERDLLEQLTRMGDYKTPAVSLSGVDIKQAKAHQPLPSDPSRLVSSQLKDLGINGVLRDEQFRLLDGTHRYASVRIAGNSVNADFENLYVMVQIEDRPGKWLVKMSNIKLVDGHDKRDNYDEGREEMKERVRIGEKPYLLLMDNPITVSRR